MNQHFPYQPKAVVIQWWRKREGLGYLEGRSSHRGISFLINLKRMPLKEKRVTELTGIRLSLT